MRSRRSYCRGCVRETAQVFVGAVNGDRPPHEYWRCAPCGLVLLTIANVPDVEGLCDAIVFESVGRRTRRTRKNESGVADPRAFGTTHGERRVDLDDAALELRAQVWIAYRSWRPDKSPSFLAFASARLRQRLIDWYRDQLGRDHPKPLSNAVSLESLGSGGDDGDGYDDGQYEGGLIADTGVDPLRAALGQVVGDDRDHSLADLRRAFLLRDRRKARSV